jgi:hypothetical protein
MEGAMLNFKVIFIAAVLVLFFFELSAENKESVSTLDKKGEISKSDIESLKKESKEKVRRISEIELLLAKRVQDAVKEKDIKWKVCLDNYVGALKGVAVSALNAGEKIPELIEAEKTDDAQSQMILLRGLADSAEKTLSEAESCERQLTNVNAESSTTKESNKKLTGETLKDSVNDAMGVGFSDKFVTETDKSVVSGSDIADASGVDSSDVNSESNSSSGEKSDSQKEALGNIDKPEVVDASPTK